VCKEEDFRYLVVRARLAEMTSVQERLQAAWKRAAPNTPYDGFFGTDAVAGAIAVSSNIRLVFLYVAGAAIVIAAMGLFALSSLIIVRRTKEIGIRKVLGASVLHVVRLLNNQLFVILLISSTAAAVGGYFSLSIMLDSMYAYHIEPQAWHYLLSAGIILLIGLTTVSGQVFRVATGNPVEALRYE
jgi:ABC-type antimicrobial peptide transport system permease subunit